MSRRPPAPSDSALALPRPHSSEGGLASPKPRSNEGGLASPKPRSGEGGWRPTFGAVPDARGATFRVWASGAQSVTLVAEGPGRRSPSRFRLERTASDVFEAHLDGVQHGALYRYYLDESGPYPDPASRFQPDGVHGLSQVIDWRRYRWGDSAWRGVRFEDLVLYELHVGTFSGPGTFRGVIDRLPHLVELGVTGIELMPVAAFAGRRNWGYDGVALFAPACQYGRPEDLQDLVDRAHGAGLAVLLDVVYNHLGPDGAYLPFFSPDFFSPHHRSPWGRSVNLDGPGSAMVRRFLVENALHWILEYHIDGLRLDATHALMDDSSQHFLEELADALHALDPGRPVHVIAEDERNLPTIVRRESAGGMGLDGVWADDFHHQVHRLLTGESQGYYADYSGRTTDIVTTVNQGWFYTGQHSGYAGYARGSEAWDVDRQRFVFCLQNHDQVGNRALGERLNHLTDLPSCRAASALLLLVPETPLIFMGEEWAASTPFLYFTDHHDELGRLVTEGRRREFERFSTFSDPGASTRIPDPQDERTFVASRLNWQEATREPHASMLRLYGALLALRGADPGMVDGGGERATVAQALDARTIAVYRHTASDRMLVVARFIERGSVSVDVGPSFGGADVVLTTEDRDFAPDAMPARVSFPGSSIAIEFARPGAVVFRVVPG